MHVDIYIHSIVYNKKNNCKICQQYKLFMRDFQCKYFFALFTRHTHEFSYHFLNVDEKNNYLYFKFNYLISLNVANAPIFVCAICVNLPICSHAVSRISFTLLLAYLWVLFYDTPALSGVTLQNDQARNGKSSSDVHSAVSGSGDLQAARNRVVGCATRSKHFCMLLIQVNQTCIYKLQRPFQIILF